MDITLSLREINYENIVICKQEKNISNKNNFYYKLNYILTYYTLYGIFINMDVHFDIEQIRTIEMYILSKINKTPKYNLYNTINKNTFSGNLIKIIGIWENNYSCGLNYKIL